MRSGGFGFLLAGSISGRIMPWLKLQPTTVRAILYHGMCGSVLIQPVGPFLLTAGLLRD